jgi:hypothetical protein
VWINLIRPCWSLRQLGAGELIVTSKDPGAFPSKATASGLLDG